MKEWVSRLLSKNFFKVRFILIVKDRLITASKKIKVQRIHTYKQLKQFDLSLMNIENVSHFKSRLELENVILFLAIVDEKVVGYYWGVQAEKEDIWHDKFLVRKGSVLLFNAFVSKDYRGYGIYKNLIVECNNYFSAISKNVITIVEKQNVPSLKANFSAGLQKAGTNYLIKFFRRNVFSIIKYRGFNVFFVLWGKKSKGL